MLSMKETEAVTAAVNKLEAEKQEGGQKLEPIFRPVADAVADGLKEFCRQEERLADAVNAEKAPFYEFVKIACKGVAERCRKRGHAEAVSSVEIYNAILERYIPGAKVRMEARLVLDGDGESGGAPAPSGAASAGFLDLFSL